MAEPLDLDAALRALYRGPLASFTAERDALAKRLRQARDGRAAEVKALRKPGLSAWAVNRLFASEPQAMAALVAAGERAREAQAAAAADTAAPARLREALTLVRSEVPRLAARGAELLSEPERQPGEAIVERLRVDLEALALSPAAREAALRGWLDEDLEPPPFEVLAALQVAAAGVLRGGAAPARAHAKPRRAAAGGAGPAGGAAGERMATVHVLDDSARAAAAARREQEARERRERERRERIERLAADAGRADEEAARRRRAAEEAERAAVEAQREAEIAAEKAAAARAAVAGAVERAQRAEAAARQAREALAAALGGG